MELLEFLLENFNVDGDNDLDALWEQIKGKFDKDDFVMLANVIVLINELPKDLCQKFWDNI